MNYVGEAMQETLVLTRLRVCVCVPVYTISRVNVCDTLNLCTYFNCPVSHNHTDLVCLK